MLTIIPSLNLIVFIVPISIYFLPYLFLKFKAPAMIYLKRPPFLPAFTIRPGQDFSNSSDSQFMTAACFTGELLVLVINSWLYSFVKYH
jgi:hypothetical protein